MTTAIKTPTLNQWKAANVDLHNAAKEAGIGLVRNNSVNLEWAFEHFLKAASALGLHVSADEPAAQQPQSLETRSFDEPYALTDSPTEIFLGPQCEENCHEGRSWSVGDRGACEDCNSPSVKYVRAARIEALEAENERLNKLYISALGLRVSAGEPAAQSPQREAALVKAAREFFILDQTGEVSWRASSILANKVGEALAAYDTLATPDPLRQSDSAASAGREQEAT